MEVYTMCPLLAVTLVAGNSSCVREVTLLCVVGLSAGLALFVLVSSLRCRGQSPQVWAFWEILYHWPFFCVIGSLLFCFVVTSVKFHFLITSDFRIILIPSYLFHFKVQIVQRFFSSRF